MLDDKDLSLFPGCPGSLPQHSAGLHFQFHQLLQDFSALENVMMPALVRTEPQSGRKRASELLEQVGLGERLLHKPSQLSGGEQQRVASLGASPIAASPAGGRAYGPWIRKMSRRYWIPYCAAAPWANHHADDHNRNWPLPAAVLSSAGWSFDWIQSLNRLSILTF